MVNNSENIKKLTGWQVASLTTIRILLGWNFLYQGILKLYDPGWSSEIYLNNSFGPLSGVFKFIASNDKLLYFNDLINTSALVIIGVTLLLGFLTRYASIAGIIILSLYYLAYPPFSSFMGSNLLNASSWIVNSNLIQIAALWMLFQFPCSKITGIDRFIKPKNNYRLS